MNRRLFLALFSTACASSVVTSAWAGDLVLIAHPSVTEKPTRSDLVAIFTTRKQTWSNGLRIVPFNFPAKHDVRVQFDRSVLGMDPDDVARFWIDRRIRGGSAPPKQVPNAATIVKLVERLEGSIAYVPREAVAGNVRLLGPI